MQMRMECGTMGAQPGPSSIGSMAVRNSVTQEGDHSGHTTRRNGGDEGVGGSNTEDGEDRVAGQSEEDPGERWFREENTKVEIRTLARLEDDLNSALLF